MLFTACVLRSLRFFKLKPEGQTMYTEKGTQKLQKLKRKFSGANPGLA